MSKTATAPSTIENFITRWKASGTSERANYQLFLTELCDLLGVEKPKPASATVHCKGLTDFETTSVAPDGL